MNIKTAQEKKYDRIIIILSIVLPLAVAALFGIEIDLELPVFLPPIYATINAVTAFILILAFAAIKKGDRKLHELLNKTVSRLSMVVLGVYGW